MSGEAGALLANRTEVLSQLDNPESTLRQRFTVLDEKLAALYGDKQLTPLTDMDTCLGALNRSEAELLEELSQLDPSVFGISTPRLGLEDVPETVTVKYVSPSQVDDQEKPKISYQYLPVPVHGAFGVMHQAFQIDHPGRELKVYSGYRSPAFQLYTFVRILVHVNEYDFGQTIRRVALPAYSQHCLAVNTALDVVNVDGQPTDNNPQDFAESIEYDWLRQNAGRFGFVESYPPDNAEGIMWEPWHWQYRGNS